MISLLLGTLIGFIMAIPPGPVAITAMQFTLDKDYWQGSMIGIGTGIVDSFLCILVFFALSFFYTHVELFSNQYPFALLSIQITIIAIIIFYGISQLKAKNNKSKLLSDFSKPSNPITAFLYGKGPLFIGIAISLANIANPSFIPSLLFITLNIQKLELFESTSLNKVFFSIGLGLGSSTWIYILVRILDYYKSKMPESLILKIRRFAGVTLIGLGALLGAKVIDLTKWAEIIRLLFAF
jgi:threonine/homoserine/homoserine lactone efflux protein